MLCLVIFTPPMYLPSTTFALGLQCSSIQFKFHLRCSSFLLVHQPYFCSVRTTYSVTFMVRVSIHATFTVRTYLRVCFEVIVVHAQLYATFAMRIRLCTTFAIHVYLCCTAGLWGDADVELLASSKNKNEQAFLRFRWFMMNNIYSPSSMNLTNLKKTFKFSF